MTLFRLPLTVFIVVVFLWAAGLIAFSVSALGSSGVAQYGKHQADAIVVLTGGRYRVKHGLTLWAQNLGPELFISGVHNDVTRQDILKKWNSADRKLPFCCLTLGHEAQTTQENALEAQRWIEDNYISRIYLVTSDYHMPRALMEFKRAMPDLSIIPHPVLEKDYEFRNKEIVSLILSEYHKYLWRKAHIYLEERA